MMSQIAEPLNLSLEERYEFAVEIRQMCDDIESGKSPGLTIEEFYASLEEDDDDES